LGKKFFGQLYDGLYHTEGVQFVLAVQSRRAVQIVPNV